MKSMIALLLAAALSVAPAAAQKKKKKPATRPRTVTAKKEPVKVEPPRMIGAEVVVTTKNGDRIKGVLLDLSAYSIRLRSDQLESTIALETIAAISFGSSPVNDAARPSTAPRPEFYGDADQISRALQTIASGAKAGADYTDYGHLLSDFRRQAERFIQRYSQTENPLEARSSALVGGALTDYTWARTVWTLKLGRAGDSWVSESESPVVSDALNLYPELRAGDRLSADKLIGGLWKKATEKAELLRSLLKR